MQRFYTVVRNAMGKTQSGATVTVYESDGITEATIYENDETTTKTNPITTTGNGIATAKIPDGEYNIEIAYSGFSSTIQGLTFVTSVPSTTQTDFISGIIEAPEDGDYKIIVKAPYGGTITEITTISSAGTCTLTGKINTTALGGTANSVSTTEQSQTHSSANVFAAGDDIVFTVSSNSSCADLSFTIKFTRTLS